MAAIDEKEYTQSFDWKIWKRLGPFLRPYRGAFVSMLVFNGICALVDVVLPLFQRYAIRNFIQADSLRGIVPFSLVYLLVILLQALSVVAFARDVADQVIFMDGGVIVEQGEPRMVMDHPKEERTRQFLARYAQG